MQTGERDAGGGRAVGPSGRRTHGGRFTVAGKKDEQVFVSTSFFLVVEISIYLPYRGAQR
jgi:hypothetical protein